MSFKRIMSILFMILVTAGCTGDDSGDTPLITLAQGSTETVATTVTASTMMHATSSTTTTLVVSTTSTSAVPEQKPAVNAEPKPAVVAELTRVIDVVASVPALATQPDSGVSAPQNSAGLNSFVQPVTGIVDETDAAKARYLNQWRYETLTAQDIVKGEDQAYVAGKSACYASYHLSSTPGGVAVTIAQLYGYTPRGVEAVYAAAIRTLCPGYNFGYLTQFDSEMLQVKQDLTTRLGVAPTLYDVGSFVKAVCSFLQNNRTADKLYEHLINNRSKYSLARGKEQVLKDSVVAGAEAHCPSLAVLLQGNMWR